VATEMSTRHFLCRREREVLRFPFARDQGVLNLPARAQ
jgi:hypothetical protein